MYSRSYSYNGIESITGTQALTKNAADSGRDSASEPMEQAKDDTIVRASHESGVFFRSKCRSHFQPATCR